MRWRIPERGREAEGIPADLLHPWGSSVEQFSALPPIPSIGEPTSSALMVFVILPEDQGRSSIIETVNRLLL